jgi:hypothetical protein
LSIIHIGSAVEKEAGYCYISIRMGLHCAVD